MRYDGLTSQCMRNWIITFISFSLIVHIWYQEEIVLFATTAIMLLCSLTLNRRWRNVLSNGLSTVCGSKTVLGSVCMHLYIIISSLPSFQINHSYFIKVLKISLRSYIWWLESWGSETGLSPKFIIFQRPCHFSQRMIYCKCTITSVKLWKHQNRLKFWQFSDATSTLHASVFLYLSLWSVFLHSTSFHNGFLKIVMMKLGFPGAVDGKESTCNAGDLGVIPVSGRSPGEGNGYPLQYSCLENSMDRWAWEATVHGVTELDVTEQRTHTYIYDETATFLLTYGEEVHVSANSPSLNTHI